MCSFERTQVSSNSLSRQPKAVSETEDLELAAAMARAQKENAEISGDEEEGSDVEE